jgi:hypothetical protein
MTDQHRLDIVNQFIHSNDVSNIILDYIQELRYIYMNKSGSATYIRTVNSNIINIRNSSIHIQNSELYLMQIESIGTAIINKKYTFRNCTYLTSIPKHIKITTWDLSNTFENCIMFNQADVSHWDVKHVVNMRSMFNNAGFNNPLNNWDVRSVKYMDHMFEGSAYDHPLDNWDILNVISMKGMFRSSKFKKDISNWDTKHVRTITGIFADSRISRHRLINKIILQWDISNISRVSMFGTRHNTDKSIIRWNLSNNGTYLAGQPIINLKRICKSLHISGYHKEKKYGIVKLILSHTDN